MAKVVFRSVKKDNLLTAKTMLIFIAGLITGVFLPLIYWILPFWAYMLIYVIVAIAILATTADILLEKERANRKAIRQPHLSV